MDDRLRPLVIYLHGGGWCLGSCFTQPYDYLCSDLSRSLECRVLSMNYRLAPEHPWPAAPEDVYRALEWLGTDESHGAVPPSADRQSIVIMGESAGANLAAVASLMVRDRQPRGVRIAHQVLFSPCFPALPRRPSRIDPARANGALLPLWLMEWFEEQYAGPLSSLEELSLEAYANPLAPGVDLSNLPPLTGVVGGAESLEDEGLEFFEAVKAAGGDVSMRSFQDGYHAFVIFPFGDSAEAWRHVRAQLRSKALFESGGGSGGGGIGSSMSSSMSSGGGSSSSSVSSQSSSLSSSLSAALDNPERRTLLLGGAASITLGTLGSNLFGATSNLLSLAPEASRRAKLDSLVAVSGFLRSQDPEGGRFSFLHPERLQRNTNSRWKQSFQRERRAKGLPVPLAPGRPVVAFGDGPPRGYSLGGEENLAVVVGSLPNYRAVSLHGLKPAGGLLRAAASWRPH